MTFPIPGSLLRCSMARCDTHRHRAHRCIPYSRSHKRMCSLQQYLHKCRARMDWMRIRLSLFHSDRLRSLAGTGTKSHPPGVCIQHRVGRDLTDIRRYQGKSSRLKALRSYPLLTRIGSETATNRDTRDHRDTGESPALCECRSNFPSNRLRYARMGRR